MITIDNKCAALLFATVCFGFQVAQTRGSLNSKHLTFGTVSKNSSSLKFLLNCSWHLSSNNFCYLQKTTMKLQLIET